MLQDDPDPDLAQATEDLYRLEPGEFVPARNELARRLRAAGNRDLAGRVAKLRRPSPAAWAVNQLARRHRADLEGLLRLGEALRAAQSRALAGADAAELREAGRARREGVARLAEAAMDLLAERGAGAGAHHGEIAATLEAASLDPQAAALVASGRLPSSLEPPSGFGALGEELAFLPPVEDLAEPGPKRRRQEPAETRPSEAAELLADARRAAAETGRVATELAAAARRQAEVAARRHREVADAEEGLTRAQRALDEARRRADAAERLAGEAQRKAAEADATAARAAEHLRQAEQRWER